MRENSTRGEPVTRTRSDRVRQDGEHREGVERDAVRWGHSYIQGGRGGG